MSEQEWEGFAKALKAKGFVGYYTPGLVSLGRYKTERYNGGVATIVHHTVRHTLGGCVQLEGCERQGVWLKDVHLINIYSPPESEGVSAEALGQFWAKEGLDHARWLIVGDFNEVPEESLLRTVLTAHGGTYVGPAVPTRWEGERCIDWAVKSQVPAKCLGIEDTERFSDHHGFWLHIDKQTVHHRKGRLKPAPLWTKPQALSQEDWRRELAEAWKRTNNTAIFKRLVALTRLNAAPDYVQEEWDTFMSCLNSCFLSALSKLAARQDEVGAQTRKALKQAGLSAKGKPGTFQWVSEAVRASGNPQPGEHLRKLRRRLARLYEVRRLRTAGQPVPHTLLHKLWPTSQGSQNGCLEPRTASKAGAT